jgi:hypothetical protein
MVVQQTLEIRRHKGAAKPMDINYLIVYKLNKNYCSKFIRYHNAFVVLNGPLVADPQSLTL